MAAGTTIYYNGWVLFIFSRPITGSRSTFRSICKFPKGNYCFSYQLYSCEKFAVLENLTVNVLCFGREPIGKIVLSKFLVDDSTVVILVSHRFLVSFRSREAYMRFANKSSVYLCALSSMQYKHRDKQGVHGSHVFNSYCYHSLSDFINSRHSSTI